MEARSYQRFIARNKEVSPKDLFVRIRVLLVASILQINPGNQLSCGFWFVSLSLFYEM